MAISLKDLRKVKATQPPRVLVYGPYGQGKTSLAAEFPNAVFLQVEDGTTSDLELDSFGVLPSFEAVLEAIGALYTEDHGYQTVVIDSLDKLEPLVWAAVCAENRWDSIETPGYGRGYVSADAFWRMFLEGLNALRRERGMAIVLIAHCDVERFDDPQTQSYSRYDIRLHKRARAIVGDEMDAILFLNQAADIKVDDPKAKQGPGTRARAESAGTRWIYTEGRPSFAAKNRYGMPPKLIYRRGEGFSAIGGFFPGASDDAAPQSDQAAA